MIKLAIYIKKNIITKDIIINIMKVNIMKARRINVIKKERE